MDQKFLNLLIEAFLAEENLNTLNRTFGVEFEMCFKASALKKYSDDNPGLFPESWDKTDFFRGNENLWNKVLQKEGFGNWEIHYDSSISGNEDPQTNTNDLALEIVTPILSGEEGLLSIMSYLEFAVNKLGGYVNDSCGGHVHIGAKDLLSGSQKQVANKFILGLLTAKKFTPLLRALVPEDRRFTRWAKPVYVKTSAAEDTLSTSSDNNSNNDHVYNLVNMFAGDRYRMINFMPLASKGTIEFRIFDGSLDYRAIEERIRFGTAFVNLLNATEIDLTQNIKSLKDRISQHLVKGPRTQEIKSLLNGIYKINVGLQKTMSITLYSAAQYTYGNATESALSNTVVNDLINAVIKYPLYRKPVNLLDHTIIVDFRTEKNIRFAKRLLQEAGRRLNFTVDGTTLRLSPVIDQSQYKAGILHLLNDHKENDYLTNKGVTPEEFLSMIDQKEAEPYKVSLEKYKADLEAGNASSEHPNGEDWP